MNKKMSLVVLGVAALIATFVVGGVVAGQFSWSAAPAPDAMARAIESAPMTRVADIEASNDDPARGVYVQLTGTGFVCVWDAPSASSRQRQGGCNPEDDPLAGSPVSASLAYEGGPSIAGVRDARLSGLASSETASLRVLMTDGTFRVIKLKGIKVGSDEFQAFGYRLKRPDLRRGIGPTAIVAFDADGDELGRQPTGIGG